MIVSITIAGLVLAIYSLLTPFFHTIIKTRRRLIKEKKEEFDRLYKQINSNSSKQEIRQLADVQMEIEKLKTFPKYFGKGILITFVLSTVSYFFNLGSLFGGLQIDFGTNMIFMIVINLPSISFALIGFATIIEILNTMRQEWKTLEKEKKEAQKTTSEELEKLKKDIEELKEKEDRRVSG